MTDFTFTASAECRRCGNYLSSSDAECDECTDASLRRYHFINMFDDSVQTVWAINPVRAWAELGKLKDWQREEILPYRLYETDMVSLEAARMGFDVTDEDELRQNS